MNDEFVDTNILVYAQDRAAGARHSRSVELLARLIKDEAGALSIQVLLELYSVATRKLAITSEEAEQTISKLRFWTIHQPGYDDVLRAIGLQRRYKIQWWDAFLLNSAIQLGCSILWTEDLNHGQKYETVTVRNPFV